MSTKAPIIPHIPIGEQAAVVYYPHTSIRSEALLKTSLLLWDYVECIVPRVDFRPSPRRSRGLSEAIDLLVRPRPASDEEKQAVHERLVALLEHGLPNWLKRSIPQGWRGERRYLIYPEKLLQETWRLF